MPEIIVALDYSNVWEAQQLISKLREESKETKRIDSFNWVKIGLELIYHPYFYDLIDYAHDHKLKIFLDAKLNDIPTTVEKTVRQIFYKIEPEFLSVRQQVDVAMKAAKDAWAETKIVHVPVLTSDTNFVDTVVKTPAPAVACRPNMAARYRKNNPNLIIICPGVRLSGDSSDDHVSETFIPREADYIVVGRPITQANDPREAFIRYQDYCQNIYK